MNNIENHMVTGEQYDDYEEGSQEPDFDPDGDILRQQELDDSLFGLAASISRLQGLSMCQKQAGDE